MFTGIRIESLLEKLVTDETVPSRLSWYAELLAEKYSPLALGMCRDASRELDEGCRAIREERWRVEDPLEVGIVYPPNALLQFIQG